MNKEGYKMKEKSVIKILVLIILIIVTLFGVIAYNMLNEKTSEEEIAKQGTSKPATIQDRRNALKSVF